VLDHNKIYPVLFLFVGETLTVLTLYIALWVNAMYIRNICTVVTKYNKSVIT